MVHDALRPGRIAARSPHARAAADRRVCQHPARSGEGARLRARTRRGASRHQARQRPDHRRHRGGHRFRNRKSALGVAHRRECHRDPWIAHADRDVDRHAGVHGARAGRGRSERGCACRSLLVRLHGVRAARRTSAVCRHDAAAAARRAHGRSAADRLAAATGYAPAARRSRDAMSREGSDEAAAERVRRRAPARACDDDEWQRGRGVSGAPRRARASAGGARSLGPRVRRGLDACQGRDHNHRASLVGFTRRAGRRGARTARDSLHGVRAASGTSRAHADADAHARWDTRARHDGDDCHAREPARQLEAHGARRLHRLWGIRGPGGDRDGAARVWHRSGGVVARVGTHHRARADHHDGLRRARRRLVARRHRHRGAAFESRTDERGDTRAAGICRRGAHAHAATSDVAHRPRAGPRHRGRAKVSRASSTARSRSSETASSSRSDS